MAIGWLLAGYQLTISYLLADHGLTMGWVWGGYGLAISYPLTIYPLAIGWLCPKINTLQDIVRYYI